MRRASDAAGGPNDTTVKAKLGDRLTVGKSVSWSTGPRCKKAQFKRLEKQPLIEDDPNLSDLAIKPIDAPHSSGERRLNQVFRLTCASGKQHTFRMLDRRVLVFRSASGLTHMIYAKPLTEAQILQLQKQLKSMKFLSDEPAKAWTENSRRALAAFAEYRGAKYRFLNPVITENLLDGLSVLPKP